MTLRRLTCVGLAVNRHATHQPHQASDPRPVHQMILVAQMPRHLTHAVKRGFKDLYVDQPHQIEVQAGLAFAFIVKGEREIDSSGHCLKSQLTSVSNIRGGSSGTSIISLVIVMRFKNQERRSQEDAADFKEFMNPFTRKTGARLGVRHAR